MWIYWKKGLKSLFRQRPVVDFSRPCRGECCSLGVWPLPTAPRMWPMQRRVVGLSGTKNCKSLELWYQLFRRNVLNNQSGKAAYAMVKFDFFWHFLEMSLVIAMKNLRLMLTGLEYHIWNSETVTGKMFKKQRFCWAWCCFPLHNPTCHKIEDGLCSSWALEWLCGMCRKIVFTFPAFTTWLV